MLDCERECLELCNQSLCGWKSAGIDIGAQIGWSPEVGRDLVCNSLSRRGRRRDLVKSSLCQSSLYCKGWIRLLIAKYETIPHFPDLPTNVGYYFQRRLLKS